MSQITTDDLKGLPHVIILRSDDDLKVIEFTGEDAMEKAHEQAQELALKDYPGNIMVCCRVRQICNSRRSHLMT